MKNLKKKFNLFLLVFGSYTKKIMSLRWFGAEKRFFKLEQVLGRVQPKCLGALMLEATMDSKRANFMDLNMYGMYM